MVFRIKNGAQFFGGLLADMNMEEQNHFLGWLSTSN